MKRLKPTFRAALQTDGTLELLVYEEIGYDFWTDGGVTAKTVKQQIDAAGTFSRIALRINSPGGDAFEGVAIFNLLRAQKKPVDVYVDGIAASAASIIAMAGDTITMGSNAMMMIHNASIYCAGTAEDLRKMADMLDKVSAAIAQTYVDRAKLTAEEVKTLMDAESWLNAQECVEKGLATAIAQNDENDDAAMAMAGRFKALKLFKNAPEKLRADSADGDGDCECECAACQDGRCSECDCSDGCDAENCGADSCNCENNAPEDAVDLSAFEAEAQLAEIRSRQQI